MIVNRHGLDLHGIRESHAVHWNLSSKSDPTSGPQRTADAGPAANAPDAAPVEPPRVQLDPALVYIAGESFQIGRAPGTGGHRGDSPPHQVTVRAFAIQRAEVTNAEYRAFTTEGNPDGPLTPPWPAGIHFDAIASRAAVNMIAADAERYCQLRFRRGRLPTEEEWELAARGPRGRFLYPWGNDFRKECLWDGAWKPGGRARATRTEPCGPTFATGIADLSGNVREWTSSPARFYPGSPLPIALRPGLLVVRGGSFADRDPDDLTATARRFRPDDSADDQTGFRCVVDLTAL